MSPASVLEGTGVVVIESSFMRRVLPERTSRPWPPPRGQGPTEREIVGRDIGHDGRQPRPQRARPDARQEQGEAETGIGAAVPVPLPLPHDQPVQPQPPQVVRDPPRRERLRARPSGGATCWRRSRAVKPSGSNRKTTSAQEQGEHPRVEKPQRRHALPVDDDRPMHPLHCTLGDGTVVADRLDVQQTSIGVKADLPQGGEVRQPTTDREVPGVVE